MNSTERPSCRPGPLRTVLHLDGVGRRVAHLMGILLVVAGLAACSRDRPRFGATPPIVLIAVDGLEWNVMLPLLAKGDLPVMARLMEAGTFGYLASMRPTKSPVIWTSVATGKTPQKHGITNFFYVADAEGKPEVRLFTSGHRSTKAFWDILSDYGLVVHCLGWWISYPAEPINGVMVSQTNTTPLAGVRGQPVAKGSLLKGIEGQVHPPRRYDEMMTILDEVDSSLPEITQKIFGSPAHPPDAFSLMMWTESLWAFRADATYLSIARRLLASKEPFDLIAVYIGGTDVVGHRFWRYAYPASFQHPPSSDQIENYGHIIDDYYRYSDQAIGELLKPLPPDTTVLIVSDHGIHASNQNREFRPDDSPSFTHSGDHDDAPPGVFIAAGWGIRAAAPPGIRPANFSAHSLDTVGSVLDITPTILALKGIPIGEDMDGTPLRQVVTPRVLEARPIRFIASHDTETWLAQRDSYKKIPVDQAQRLEQLRALGYIR